MSRKVEGLAPTRNKLIAKGMIWSPNHGDTAFTVPLFVGEARRLVICSAIVNPTAMGDPTPRDLANTLMAEFRERHARDSNTAQRLHAQLSEVLEEQLPVGTRAWLIGSLARGTWREGSDIDVVVEGLTHQQASVLWNAIADKTGIEPDVLRFEELDDRARDRAKSEGKLLVA